MIKWLQQKLIGKYLASTIRTALAALGGFLIARFGLDEGLVAALIANTTEVILALAPLLLAQIWSWVQKYLDSK